MWRAQVEALSDKRGLRFTIEFESRPATVAGVLRAWQSDADFRSMFNSLLADTPYTAYRWETPPVTAATMSQPFVCVLLDSPGLACRPEPEAFAQHFRNATGDVAVFPNLGGDAIMVVPCPLVDAVAYGHVAAFVRLAPQAQQHALWQAVGQAMTRRVGARPVWLSTAGAGVSWLHVRLDDRPKYLSHGPYRRWDESGA